MPTTDQARQTSASVLQAAQATVTPVIAGLQGGTPVSADAVTGALSTLQNIQTAIQNFANSDTINAYQPQTSSILGDISTIAPLLNAAVSAIQSSRLQVLSSDQGSQLGAAWADLLSKAGGIAGIANQIDGANAQSSAAASSGAAAQAAAAGSLFGGGGAPTSGGSSSSSSSTSTITPPLPPTSGSNPPPAPPPSTVAPTSSSILPAVTPAAAIAIGVGGVLLIGVIVSAMRAGAVLNPLPNPRRRRRSRRRRSRRSSR